MSHAQSSNPMPSRHYGACSRCQSILDDTTRFFTEEARCSVAQASSEQLVQRADTLIISMACALHELGWEIPEAQRDLWIGEQMQRYIAAIDELRRFILSMQQTVPV